MERDDLLLCAIAEGATSSAALAERTGLSPASVWRGLRRLMESEHVFSPARGVYRLTASGERALTPRDGELASTADQAPRDADPRSLRASSVRAWDPGPSSGPAGAPAPEPRGAPEPTELPGNRAGTEGGVTPRAWLLGGALVALGVGAIALRALVARAPAPAPPAVAPPPPAPGWPYNGQTWGW